MKETVSFFYADGGDAWIDEDWPIERQPFSDASLDAEDTTLAFTGDGRRGVVLRFGLFYSPRRPCPRGEPEDREARPRPDDRSRRRLSGIDPRRRRRRRGRRRPRCPGRRLQRGRRAHHERRVERRLRRRVRLQEAARHARPGDEARRQEAVGPRRQPPHRLDQVPRGHRVVARAPRRHGRPAGRSPPRTRRCRHDPPPPGRPRRDRRSAPAWSASGPRVAPKSFYEDFPGAGRVWVAVDGPYNEHLVRDVGSLNLALAFVAVAGADHRQHPAGDEPPAARRCSTASRTCCTTPPTSTRTSTGDKVALLLSLGVAVLAAVLAPSPATHASDDPASGNGADAAVRCSAACRTRTVTTRPSTCAITRRDSVERPRLPRPVVDCGTRTVHARQCDGPAIGLSGTAGRPAR